MQHQARPGCERPHKHERLGRERGQREPLLSYQSFQEGMMQHQERLGHKWPREHERLRRERGQCEHLQS